MKVRVCLVILLVIWVSEQQVQAQCYTENILGTMTGSVELNQEDFSMKDMLGSLHGYNRTFNLPILTSAHVIGKKIMIQGRKRSTLLDPDLMATLLKSVNIENLITLEGHPAISFINEGSRRMLKNIC